MKLRQYNYRQALTSIIKEEILKFPNLLEIFDSLPFKTTFEFKNTDDEIKCNPFKDNQGNRIQVIFHKMRNECYEVDFTVNGNSLENLNISYSIKEYTSLISTIFKCIEQFLNDYNPNGLDMVGVESSDKIEAGKKGQKNVIYKYALKGINLPSNYVLLTNKSGGSQILKK